MSRICDICSKRPQVGNTVSHANNRAKRWVYPNVQTLRYTVTESAKSTVHRGQVCTKCIKAQKVQKVV